MRNTNILKILNYLSLDVALGAMVCHATFTKLPDGHHYIDSISTYLLGVSVFIIYTLDRLLDNKKIGQIPTQRHLFHKQFEKPLKLAVVLSLLAGLLLLSKISYPTLMLGFSISFITIIYLSIVSKLSIDSILQAYKEPITALVYAAGVWGTAMVQHPHELSLADWMIGLVFLLIAFQNLLLFSTYEQKNFPQVHSLASVWGFERSKNIIRLLFGLVLSIALWNYYGTTSSFQKNIFVIETAMSLVLFVVCNIESFFIKNERYRWIGDAIFFFPILLLI
jgi:hypothetical protein